MAASGNTGCDCRHGRVPTGVNRNMRAGSKTMPMPNESTKHEKSESKPKEKSEGKSE